MRGRPSRVAIACLWLIPCASTIAACAGCSRPPANTVTGSVTWNGLPLAYGAISFLPADGASRTAGAVVTDGRYVVIDVPPGEKIVQVISGSPPREPGGSSDVPPPLEFMIPPNAIGNGERHTIIAGQQVLDLQLFPAAS